MRYKRENSRQHLNYTKHLVKCKRSQVTVFVILAIAIVAVLFIVFLPNIKNVFVPTPVDVKLQSCLEESVEDAFDSVLPRGGRLDPDLYYNYNGEPVDYICYTNEWYKTCVMQKPLFKQSIEAEVEIITQPQIVSCINELENSLKSKGYSLETSGEKSASIILSPSKITINLDYNIVAKKDDRTESYERLGTSINSNYYEMVMIASSISNWEAHYGDSSPETYMSFYPNMKVEKKKQSDGTTIYIITDRTTEDKLQFASRSVAWPPGYAQ